MQNTAKIVQVIFIGSLVPALLAALLLALLWQSHIPLLLLLVLYAFGGHFLIRFLAERGRAVEWILSIAVLNLLILTPELYLRLFQFHYEAGIQFVYPRSFVKFAPDRDLFWTYPMGEEGVNSFGFRQDEVSLPKPENVCRVLFLGDSVVEQGYAEVVEVLLNEHDLSTTVESVNMGLSGYSSYQGRVLVDKYGDMIDPDLVLVSYGWNDHWLAYGAIDSEKVINTDLTATQQLFQMTYTNSRLLQWLRYVFSPILGKEIPLAQVRVPLEQYIDNLSYIYNHFARNNIPAISITPPTAHCALVNPDYHVTDGFATDKASVIRLHRDYNQALRETGAANNWLVLDLEKEYEADPNLAQIFISDGIHLTDQGLQIFATEIADSMLGLGCLQPEDDSA